MDPVGLSTNFCSVLFCWIQIPAMMLVFFPSFVVVKSPKKMYFSNYKKDAFYFCQHQPMMDRGYLKNLKTIVLTITFAL